MSFKKTDKIIEELEARFFIVEGEVSDLLTRETMQNLNANMQSATGAIAVGSALAGQIGNAALASFAASDEGIEVSVFAIQITDKNNEKHIFKGCFPVVMFKKGDVVKLIVEANPYDRKYDRVAAVIDQKNNYMWTGQEVVKGRLTYRVWGMKFFGLLGVICIFLCIIILLFLDNGKYILTDKYGILVLLFFLFSGFVLGWRIGASFDEQSVELEAILKNSVFLNPVE